MPSPQQTDRAIQRNGEPVVLQRKVAGSPPTTWTLAALVRGYSAQEIANDIQVGDREVIISALSVTRKAIPEGPRHLDDVLRDGRTGKVQSVELVKGVGGVPDRYILRVRGFPA